VRITYIYRPWLGTRFGPEEIRTSVVIGPRSPFGYWPIGNGVSVHESAVEEWSA
jgi:hypothetical protein